MNEIVQYVLEVVVLPALAGVLCAAPFLIGPLRRRRWMVEGATASAVAIAFLVSFLVEPGWKAIARQLVAIENDDAPFERWHRLGLVAAVLVAAAWMLSLFRGRDAAPRTMLRTIGTLLVLGVLAAVFVEFPKVTVAGRIGQGALVFTSGIVWMFAGSSVAWSAWVVFGVLAALAALGGFASLSVMCGAASVAAYGVGALGALGAHGVLGALVGARDESAAPAGPGGAVMAVFGALTALIASCGIAYDTAGLSPAVWVAACMLPLAALVFNRKAKRSVRPFERAFWSWLGVAIAAGILLGATAGMQAMGAEESEADDALMDMYGG
ncbi:MAG: hypothetical protein RLZZ238_1221 [Planctomycetota bacterium]|jgi:hypothetical protein